MNRGDVDKLDWAKGDGLLPAVVQHADSGAALMLGYMNREALAATLASGFATFYSRSRRRLWQKGETSGNRLALVSVSADCDGDALLVQARPAGPACHEGTPSCFARAAAPAAAPFAFLAALESVIDARLADPAPSSYTARLHAEGLRRVAQKAGEEAFEFVLAAAGGNADEVVTEGADLLFHVALLLRERGLSLADVTAELGRRHAERLRGAVPAVSAADT